MTTTTTSSSTLAASGSSILKSLNAGSGIDTDALVTSLVSATFDPKDNALKARETANTAKISTLGNLSSGIDAFASALQSLVAGGTLKSQPSSSNPAILTATAQSGATLSGLSTQLQVRQLAQSQVLESPALTSSSDAAGQGRLTLSSAAGSFTIDIDSTNDSLTGLASAINAKNSGVTASVITDSTGARLVLRGTATGKANSFSLTADPAASADLKRFASTGAGSAMVRDQEAQDAIVRVDGVDSSYTSNVVTGLVSGVTLNLVSAQPGTTVTLGVNRPTSAISQAVTNYVDAYNELKKQIDSATAAGTGDSAGPFQGNNTIREMQRQLSRLNSTTLSSLPGGPQTLAEIGVSTGRDGQLSLDSTKLSSALSTYPDAVEAMFNPSQRSDSPLVKITSGLTATKPGTYTIANIVAGSPPSGNIGGVAGLPSGSNPKGLVASITSPAAGLEIEPLGDVLTATITVDPGLSGALQSIRDGLRASTGILKALSDSLTTEQKSLADARTKMTTQEDAYKDQLSKQFSTMQTQVASYKAIQSYLTQQIDMWSKSG